MSTDLLGVPAAELSKWDVFRKLGWRPHAAQRDVLRATNRMKVVSAGRRAGKSEIGGHDLVPEALATHPYRNMLKQAGKRREFWVVGPEYSDSEKEFRILYNSLSTLGVPFDRPGTYNDPLGGNMHISLWDGTFQVHAKSAKHPETLVGEGLSGVVLAEAAKLKHRVWTKFLRPTLADFTGWALMTSTPEGKNWFFECYNDGQNIHMPDWYSYRAPSWCNPYVYRKHTTAAQVKQVQEMMNQVIGNRRHTAAELVRMFELSIDEEIVAMLDELTEESFNQEIGADFSEFVGRVFKGWDEDVHVRDLEYNPKWETYACTDYGFTNPNVWLLIQVGPWNEIHVLDEVYERGLTDDQFAEEILNRGLCPWNLICFYPDPEDPGATKVLENILKVRHGGGTGGLRKDRIDSIREALRRTPQHLPDDHEEKQPTLLVNRRCERFRYDMGAYRYPDTKEEQGNAKEEPMKKDDHGPEALGRFMAGRFGTPSAQNSGTRVHKANFTRTPHKDPLDGKTINPDGTLNYPHSRPPDNAAGRQYATPAQLRSTKRRNW